MLTIPRVTAAILRDDRTELSQLIYEEARPWADAINRTRLSTRFNIDWQKDFLLAITNVNQKYIWQPFALDILREAHRNLPTSKCPILPSVIRDYETCDWVRLTCEHTSFVSSFCAAYHKGHLIRLASYAAAIYNRSSLTRAQLWGSGSKYYWGSEPPNPDWNRQAATIFLRKTLLNAVEIARVRTNQPKRS